MKSNFLTRVFNISGHEWPRVSYAFGLELGLVLAHVLGHAILIAFVTEHFGAAALPYLWITAAGLTMIATALVAPLLERLDKKILVYGLALGAGALILGGNLLYLQNEQVWSYLTLTILGMSALGATLHITVGMLVESLFSPLEAERTFPFVGSSLLIGGFLGGGLITLLTSGQLHFGVTELTWIWVGVYGLVLLVNLIWHLYSARIPHTKKQEEEEQKGLREQLGKAIAHLRKLPFAKALAWFVLAQFVVIQLLEFQYASALAEGGDSEHLIHGLGFYGAIFSGVGLIVQILFARRAVHYLGIARTMLFNPLLSIVPFAAMGAKFGAPSAVTSKLVFQSSNVVARNAYLASFYAIPEKIREHVKPLIEGWVNSLGAILGTGALIVLEEIWRSEGGEIPPELTLSVSLLLVVLAVFMTWQLWKLKDHYTQLSVKNLRSNEIPEKHTAIEILAQRGHKNGTDYLIKSLAAHKRDPEIKAKVLQVLGYAQNPEAIPAILDQLRDADFEVRMQAVQALNNFEKLGKHFFNQAFARFRITNALEVMFKGEDSKRLKQEIVRTFAKLNQVEIVPFLLEILNTKDNDLLVADCIAVIGSFQDPNIAHYLQPFLTSPNPQIRANAIIALWQFPRHRLDLIAPQLGLLSASDPEGQRAMIWMLGETRNVAEKKKLQAFLAHEDEEIRHLAALALAKMGEGESEKHLLEALLNENEEHADKFWRHIETVHPRLNKRLKRAARHELVYRAGEILSSCEHDLCKLKEDKLRELERAYRVLGESGEVAKIREVREKCKLKA